MKKTLILGLVGALLAGGSLSRAKDAASSTPPVERSAESAARGQFFDDGNYAMFIHWGLYSLLANKVDGKTYYGIGEWIMDPLMAGIPLEKYKALANQFNPTEFDAKAIVKLAKDAGMKYIVITAKHHEGFAMYHSKANAFNVVDATPWKTDPMNDLAAACREAGLGFGFYYSHSQDWTTPGGQTGSSLVKGIEEAPKLDEQGNVATFDDYFTKKCLPQIEELTTQYGPIEVIWFDTPGKTGKEYVEQVVEIVRRNQPKALVSGRVGHDMGDYQSLGDMEVPRKNIEGRWESVDTTNNSWGYAWYDENWKTPREILHRLISCVARGGTYMLNVGLTGDGAVPERAARSLREAGEWIHRHPQVVYGAGASPWGHALPWGDVTAKGNRLFLSVFDWPASGNLYLPGLKTGIESVQLVDGDDTKPIAHKALGGWTVLELPPRAPEKLVSVIEVGLDGAPEVDPVFGIDPDIGTEIFSQFATATGAEIVDDRWMEKFGEWVREHPVRNWTPGGKAVWEVDVLEPGDYAVALTYAGEGRLVWGVDVVGGEHIQNQQNSSHNYQEFPIGWINFPAPGKYKVAVSCLEGKIETAKLKAIRFTPIK